MEPEKKPCPMCGCRLYQDVGPCRGSEALAERDRLREEIEKAGCPDSRRGGVGMETSKEMLERAERFLSQKYSGGAPTLAREFQAVHAEGVREGIEMVTRYVGHAIDATRARAGLSALKPIGDIGSE